MIDRLPVARTSRRSRCLSQASSCDLSRRSSGYYTASSRLQAAGLTGAMAIFEEAAALVPLPKPPQPIVIADYGASTAHNSLLPICAAIAVLRKRTRHDHSTLVVHTDVPDNDFTAMWRTLAEDPDSYLAKDAATFASAVGRSFYAQILPSSSVNLGWSSYVYPVAEPSSVADTRPHPGRLQQLTRMCGPNTRGRPPTTGTSSSRSAAGNCVPAAAWW